MNAPDDTPRDWRWSDAPRPDPVTGAAPLAPTALADDPASLLAEHDAFAADWPNRTLRVGLVSDLAAALGRALAERDDARRELDALRDDVELLMAAECPPDAPCPRLRAVAADRDRLARRIQGMVAIGHGARYRLTPEPDAGDAPP